MIITVKILDGIPRHIQFLLSMRERSKNTELAAKLQILSTFGLFNPLPIGVHQSVNTRPACDAFFETAPTLFSPTRVDAGTGVLLKTNDVVGAHIEQSDGFRNFQETEFTKILCNPPYRCQFSAAKHLIEKSFNRLIIGGALWMVTKRDKWYRNKLTSIFGGVRVSAANTYFVFEARKNSYTYASRMPRSR